MIRKLQNADMDRVAGIWLDANLRAHCFISPQYWKSNFDPVKEMLPRAEVYVYENGREIWGFIGLNGEYIEGIFVSGEMQSRGIGKRLLDFVKTKKTELRLNVYQKNTRAIRFYQREGFKILREGTVSEKHCGFVVNLGGATCADVLALCDEVRAVVKEKTGYDLEKEIRVVKA